MSMKNGVKKMVNAALDTNHETFKELLSGGMDPVQANLASTIMTKGAVAAKLDTQYENASAREITHGLKKEGTQPSKTH